MLHPFELHRGDCLEVLRAMADNSVDSIVTDPPYGLKFMGKKWDCDVPAVEVWQEALRVLKPGGYLLAFAGTRTQHRMAVRIEDAGFEIRDLIMWVYGSGFPKSHNGEWGGTALKPALEPITMARKPLDGTVEANWQQHGTGALNIDGCRVDPTGERLGGGDETGKSSKPEGWARPWMDDPDQVAAHNAKVSANVEKASQLGRWPANLVHDGSEEVVALFPAEAGAVAPVTVRNGDKFRGTYGAFSGNIDEAGSTFHGDAGSAARFFYCAKASRSDRDEGCEKLVGQEIAGKGNGLSRTCQSCDAPVIGGCECPDRTFINPSRKNHHPTVKPTDLMAYLCRLVTPKGGVVLDLYMGSGTTGKAAIQEGFRFIGIERDQDEDGKPLGYMQVAEARCAAAAQRRSDETAQQVMF